MTDQSIPEVMFTMISLLFLLLGVVLIASILMSALNPYEQVVYANTEKMRAAMDQACLGNTVSTTFSFPQNTPEMTGLLTVLPIWIITTNGDPNYVLYYESFPPGEATGWEVYQNMQNRLVAYIPDGWVGRVKDDVDKYAEDVVAKAKGKTGLIEGVIIGNIMLGETRTDYYVGDKSSTIQGTATTGTGVLTTKVLSKYGEWQRKGENGEPLEGDNYFKFKNYIALNSFEKSAIKYLTCGENSLCLKTRTGVYRFPLKNCENIKAAQIIYDETAGGRESTSIKTLKDTGLVVGGALSFKLPILKLLGKVGGSGLITYGVSQYVKDVLIYTLGVKTQDFAIASPCNIKDVVVEKAACSNFKYEQSDFWTFGGQKWEMNPCVNVMDYTLYKYDASGKLVPIGSRSICTEKLGTSIDTVDAGTYGSEEQCIRVFVKTKEDFCWTSDPYKKSDKVGFFWNKQEFLSALPYISKWIMPIHNYTAIIAHDDKVKETIVLTPTDIALKNGEEFFSQLDRKWWWGWPGV